MGWLWEWQPLQCQGMGTANPRSARAAGQSSRRNQPGRDGLGSSEEPFQWQLQQLNAWECSGSQLPPHPLLPPLQQPGKSAERSQGETRTDLSVQRNLSLSSENSPLSAARWPLLGCPSQEWKCLSRTTEGGVHRSCSQLQTSPHCLLPPQVYKNAGFPLPSKSWKWETAGSGTGRGFLGSPTTTTTTTTGGRCLWGQFCAMF